jgi:hypothetical protein
MLGGNSKEASETVSSNRRRLALQVPTDDFATNVDAEDQLEISYIGRGR